jgi:hypothetical protein
MLKGETVANVLIGQHGSGQIPHDLMHVHQNLPGIFWVKDNWLNAAIDLAPLLRPVGADGFRPPHKTAFEGPRPGYIGRHDGESRINIARVEGRICRAEQFDFWCRLIGHKMSVKWTPYTIVLAPIGRLI